jgi:hypothetical protein
MSICYDKWENLQKKMKYVSIKFAQEDVQKVHNLTQKI